jgi:chromosome segregation ATPase
VEAAEVEKLRLRQELSDSRREREAAVVQQQQLVSECAQLTGEQAISAEEADSRDTQIAALEARCTELRIALGLCEDRLAQTEAEGEARWERAAGAYRDTERRLEALTVEHECSMAVCADLTSATQQLEQRAVCAEDEAGRSQQECVRVTAALAALEHSSKQRVERLQRQADTAAKQYTELRDWAASSGAAKTSLVSDLADARCRVSALEAAVAAAEAATHRERKRRARAEQRVAELCVRERHLRDTLAVAAGRQEGCEQEADALRQQLRDVSEACRVLRRLLLDKADECAEGEVFGLQAGGAQLLSCASESAAERQLMDAHTAYLLQGAEAENEEEVSAYCVWILIMLGLCLCMIYLL